MPPPPEFLCPISLQLMHDPVTLSSGITYDRPSIQTWLHCSPTCPVSRQPLSSLSLTPNRTLQRLILSWIDTHLLLETAQHLPLSCHHLPPPLAHPLRAIFHDLVSNHKTRLLRMRQLHSIARDSALNTHSLSSVGADVFISSLLLTYAPKVERDDAEAVEICKEVLGTLGLLSISEEATNILSDDHIIACVVSILCNERSEAGRLYAVKVLARLTSNDSRWMESIGYGMDNLMRGLLQSVNRPGARKACLHILLVLLSPPRQIINCRKCVKVEAIPILVELLADADRGICERVLVVVNLLLSCAEGRAAAMGHALTIPVIVKKMLRVSIAATQAAVEALVKLCQAFPHSRVIQEAVEAGAMKKTAALLMQTDTDPLTRETAKQLRRLLSEVPTFCK